LNAILILELVVWVNCKFCFNLALLIWGNSKDWARFGGWKKVGWVGLTFWPVFDEPFKEIGPLETGGKHKGEV